MAVEEHAVVGRPLQLQRGAQQRLRLRFHAVIVRDERLEVVVQGHALQHAARRGAVQARDGGGGDVVRGHRVQPLPEARRARSGRLLHQRGRKVVGQLVHQPARQAHVARPPQHVHDGALRAQVLLHQVQRVVGAGQRVSRGQPLPRGRHGRARVSQRIQVEDEAKRLVGRAHVAQPLRARVPHHVIEFIHINVAGAPCWQHRLESLAMLGTRSLNWGVTL
mmetsp:Transcript_27910/g.71173  ORF Transcript_27910/g.71173 Transcript_27910/m.71173 type:complete len:221 (-) Transcript_27910:272-934(-)